MKDTTPKKQIIVKVCNDCSCAEKGAESIMKKIEQAIGLAAGKKNKDYDLDYGACVGCCDFGPNLLVNDNLVLGVNKDTVMEEIVKAAEVTALNPEEKRVNLDKILNEELL